MIYRETPDYKQFIGNIPDFPKEGILYRDIQPLLENEFEFNYAIDQMGELVSNVSTRPDYWVGIESRGFLFASALSIKFGGGVKLIRKKGKLPNKELKSITYDLEYGADTIEMKPGEGTVVIVDDVFATGGTMFASESLCKASGYDVIGKLCLVDIGIRKNHDVKCLITY